MGDCADEFDPWAGIFLFCWLLTLALAYSWRRRYLELEAILGAREDRLTRSEAALRLSRENQVTLRTRLQEAQEFIRPT